ncbi:MAG: DNA-binding protein [Cyanobacteria bacterium CYA]|nr:MAG: DNA-binding protein [Cyanobacteria bacterium CYA]
MGISPRTLWALTAPRGPIPCVRVGGCVLFRVADLDEWLRRAAEGGAK